MKVSIITVCYNSVQTIKDTIDSVLDQRHKEIEYIIIDGGSTDGTKELIKSYGNKIHHFISEKDEGIYDAMNKGIQFAKGEIIALLNSDDFYYDNDVISNVVNCFKESKSDFVYGDCLVGSFERSSSEKDKIARYWAAKPYNRNDFYSGWMPPHPSSFIRKEVYEKYGLFDTAFEITADYELLFRFLFKHKISCTPLPLACVKMRTGGVSDIDYETKMKVHQEVKDSWLKNGEKAKFYTFFSKNLRGVMRLLKSKLGLYPKRNNIQASYSE